MYIPCYLLPLSIYSSTHQVVTRCQKLDAADSADSRTMDQLKPPEQLLINSPNKADAWRQFKHAFEMYLSASGLKDKDGATQA